MNQKFYRIKIFTTPLPMGFLCCKAPKDMKEGKVKYRDLEVIDAEIKKMLGIQFLKRQKLAKEFCEGMKENRRLSTIPLKTPEEAEEFYKKHGSKFNNKLHIKSMRSGYPKKGGIKGTKKAPKLS